MRRLSKLLIAIVITAISASLLAGCAPKSPAKEMVLDPQIVKSWTVDYWVASDAASTAISPDNKYMLLVQSGPSERVVAAIPLASGDSKEVQLYKVSNSYLETANLDFLTVGWLSATDCVFLAVGSQALGPNEGKRGVSVLVGNVSTGKVDDAAFIPLEQGYVHNVRFPAGSGKVYLDVTQAIWTVDLATKAAKIVKDGLPTYDGMFMARMSPDSSSYVYQLHELDAGHGIFILDAVTGVQKSLAPNGDTMGFYPSWSPDSKYVAFYTVPRKPGRTGTVWPDYEIYPGEDGPMGIAPAITVMDKSGKVVSTISIEGKVIANFKWSPDSKSIAFTTGPKPATVPDTEVDWDIPVISWDGVYVSKASEQGTPTKLTDIDPKTTSRDSYVSPIAFDPQNRGVFLQISSSEGESTIWYAASGKTPVQTEEGKPVKIADGYWQFYPDVPTFADTVAAVIGSPSGQTGLWLLNSKEIKKVGEWPGNYTMVIAYNQEMLVTCETTADVKNTITVRSMFTEKTVTK